MMINVTISAKVPEVMTQRISKTGYSVSDMIQVSLNMFLDMSKEEQNDYMLKHMQEKKVNRAIARYQSAQQLTESRKII